MKKNGKIAIGAMSAIVPVFIVCGLVNPLSVSEETVSTGRAGGPVRIALVSDLHSCFYGDDPGCRRRPCQQRKQY